MASRKAADPKYYYGEVEHSLQHLPRWYQFCSLGGVLWVIYAKNNPVLVWIVRHLHSSFYTENMWHSSYRTQLEHMSFNERVCFTLYGMALALVAALLFRVFCHDHTRVGTPLSQLFPDRKGHTIFVLLSLCAVEVCTIYWEIDAQFSSPHSKLLHMVEAHNESMHDGAGVRNIHYIVQREVMKRYLQGVILHRILAMIITAAIRFMIDAPWRKHVALRWYMATYAAVLVAMEMISIFVYQNWSNYTSLVCILWGLTYIGLLNYTFGPSLRAGTIATADIFTCVKEACKSIATIFMVWMMATIIVFTAIVSFNVVELIGIWVMMTLMILWFPAIIDSCSTSFMVFLTALTCYVAVAMEALNLVGATRFGMVLLGLWLNTSLLYNATVHLCQTRTVGVVLIVSLATWFMLPSLAWMRAEAAALAPPTPVALSAVAPERRRTLQVLASIATHVYYFDVYFMGMLTAHLDVLLRVAAFRPLPPTTPPMLLRISGGEGAVAFQRLMEFFVVAAAGLLLILRLIKKYQGPERKAKMRRLCVPLITVGLLFRKSIRTVVLVVNVVVFLCSWHVAKLMVVPTLVVVLPEVAAKAIAAVVSCAVLGSMMDMKETTYESIIRIMGGMDPPDVHDTVDGSSSSDDDRQPVEEGSPT